MRININNELLPGWQSEIVPSPVEIEQACKVYDPEGAYVGKVLYIGRKHTGQTGTEYGWVPDRPGTWAQTGKVEAVRKLTSGVSL